MGNQLSEQDKGPFEPTIQMTNAIQIARDSGWIIIWRITDIGLYLKNK
jgi:hypothetical protein